MNRTIMTLSGAALAVVALTACGTTRTTAPSSQGTGSTPTAASTPTTPTPTTPAPTTPAPKASASSESAAPAHVTTYPGTGVEVVRAADVRKLTGTSDAFRSFVAATARQAAADGSSCPDAFHGVTVQKYSTAGYALGGVNSCGGYEALWAVKDGTWILGMGTQDEWSCATLRYLHVPRSFAGGCGKEGGGFGPTEVSGLRLGMTPAQITSAGGRVATTSTKGCRKVTLPYHTPGDGSSAVVSPTVGLAVVFAGSGQLTPEGIGLGSSLAEVKKAYPHGHRTIDSSWTVPLPGGADYQFLVDDAKQVYEMDLIAERQDCVG